MIALKPSKQRTLYLFISVIIFFISAKTILATNDCSSYLFVVDPPTKIYGPGWYADSQLETFPHQDGLYAYTGVQDTYLFQGQTMESLQITDHVTIGRGQWGQFDGDGAWLMSVWQSGGIIRGLYHAENCHTGGNPIGQCPDGVTKHKAIAYCQSSDGGKTFTKPNYPNNLVLYPDKIKNTGNGDFSMIQIENHYYIFFLLNAGKGVGVAKSPVSDNGSPGTWTKYYQGSFSQPGINGKADKILDGYSSHVIYNEFLKKYILITLDNPHNIIFYLSDWHHTGNNQDIGTKWKKFPKIIVPAGDGFWGQDPRQNQGFIAYPSIAGLNGQSETVEKDFYLTYTHMSRGDATTQQLVKIIRKVRLFCNQTDDALVSLQIYKNTQTNNTIETVHYWQDPQYSLEKVLAYIKTDTDDINPTTAFDLCYYNGWQNNFLKPQDNSCDQVNEKKWGQLGFLYKQPIKDTLPIYQCFDSNSTKHHLSINYNPCQTYILGYAYPQNYRFTNKYNTCSPTKTDYNQDGQTNTQDLTYWYLAYKSQTDDNKADFNCDNTINISDLILWYQNYKN